MPIYDFFKNIFGGSIIDHHNVNNEEKNYRDQFLNPNYDQREEQWSPQDDRPSDRSHFNLFSDPIEMHRFFEQQMQEVFKAFGIFGGGKSFFGDFEDSDKGSFHFGDPENGGSFFFGNVPPIEDEEASPSSLRDHFLKPGYRRPSGKSTEDSDLDGKINPGDVDSLLKTDPSDNRSLQRENFQNSIIPQIRSFGQSVSTKTIRNADGSVETHRTVRDSAGNEETTIVKQFGDKQHTLTIRTDRNGKQERIEDFVNMEEKDLPEFNSKWQKPPSNQPDFGYGSQSDWANLFDKFFK